MNFSKRIFNLFLTLLLGLPPFFGHAQEWKNLAKPTTDGVWLRPAQHIKAQPVWGFVNGIQVGLAPMPGPRGLLRIYTPYLGHKEGKMINFIAMEPIPDNSDRRGLSELEMSALDNERGKRFWSSNDSLSFTPKPATSPAAGLKERVRGVETLTVFIFSEAFDNGAKVYVRMRFYKNKPFEVEFTTYTYKNSVELNNLILTATMGNFARLRTLYLAGSTKNAGELWPDYTKSDFADHDHTTLDAMIKNSNGTAYFIAAPNEKDPVSAHYADDTNDHWKYYGKKATQYWIKKDPDSSLEGLVNGRYAYWASTSPIPGGIAFENFELKENFHEGATFVFGVSPDTPEAFIKEIERE